MTSPSSPDASARTGHFLADGRQLPDDFDALDIALARLLNEYFDLTGGCPPPCSAQAQLVPASLAFAGDDLPDRITAKVFDRLGADLTTTSPTSANQAFQRCTRRHIRLWRRAG